MTFASADLRGIAVLAEASYDTPADDDDRVSLIAGRGEVQLIADGTAWYLNWDPTHAINDCIQLTPPEGNNIILAAWLVQQADKYKEF